MTTRSAGGVRRAGRGHLGDVACPGLQAAQGRRARPRCQHRAGSLRRDGHTSHRARQGIRIVQRRARRDGRASNPHHGTVRPAGPGGHRRRSTRNPGDVARGTDRRRGVRSRPIRHVELRLGTADRRRGSTAIGRRSGVTATSPASADRTRAAVVVAGGASDTMPPNSKRAWGEASHASRSSAHTRRTRSSLPSS